MREIETEKEIMKWSRHDIILCHLSFPHLCPRDRMVRNPFMYDRLVRWTTMKIKRES